MSQKITFILTTQVVGKPCVSLKHLNIAMLPVSSYVQSILKYDPQTFTLLSFKLPVHKYVNSLNCNNSQRFAEVSNASAANMTSSHTTSKVIHHQPSFWLPNLSLDPPSSMYRSTCACDLCMKILLYHDDTVQPLHMEPLWVPALSESIKPWKQREPKPSDHDLHECRTE